MLYTPHHTTLLYTPHYTTLLYTPQLRKWGTTGLLATYGVLLVVLLVLYGSSDSDSDSSSPSGAIASFPSTAPLSAAQVGLGASLSSSGALQLGGGTSVYRDLYSLPPPSACAKAPVLQPAFLSSFVMTFIDGIQSTHLPYSLCTVQ
jgi:hypothetical protein